MAGAVGEAGSDVVRQMPVRNDLDHDFDDVAPVVEVDIIAVPAQALLRKLGELGEGGLAERDHDPAADRPVVDFHRDVFHARGRTPDGPRKTDTATQPVVKASCLSADWSTVTTSPLNAGFVVHVELVVAELTAPMPSPDGEGTVNRYVAVIGHTARDGADTTLCHLPTARFQAHPELAFSPRPLGMERCQPCFTAYAHTA